MQPAASAPGKGGPQGAAPSLAIDARTEFDQGATPGINAKVREQSAKYDQDQETYQRQSQKARDDGEQRIAEETERTRTQQEGLREQAQEEVDTHRDQWRDENRKIQEDYGTKSSDKQREIDRQIEEKVQTAQARADTELTSAETEADAERVKAEAKAAEKKQEAENKPRSWWERVKGVVSDAFDAIRDAVNGIFDELRKAVKALIEAAKSVVHAIIDAARDAIVGFIKAFGEFVKGLVTIALAAFPELAAKARAWIDKKVGEATDAVNRAAEALKDAADAALDAVGAALDAALSAMQAGFNAALDALEFLAKLAVDAMEAVAKLVEMLTNFGPFLDGARKVMDDPGAIIDALKQAIGGMIGGVPAAAYAKLQEFAGQFGGSAELAPAGPAPATAGPSPATRVQRQPDTGTTPAHAKRHVSASQHLSGILRHLGKGLDHLKTNWWEELKKVGWNLLWPWPAVWGDLKDIWKEIKVAWAAAWDLKVSQVIDSVLTMTQKINSILGNLYGWFFIASVLIGAIIGAFFGGAGAIPGALAGAAFAGEVGEALVIGLITTEAAVIVKSVADLSIGNDTGAEDEDDYSKIGGSTLTIAITVAMMLLGEIAAKLAKSIWEGVVGLFKGERPPEVKVNVEGGETKGPSTDTPEVKGEAPEIVDGERVVASEKSPDGHEVKVTEEGTCLVCTTCEEIGAHYREQLKGDSPEIREIKGELETAREMPNGEPKAAEIERIREKLEKIKSAEAGSPAQVKMQAMEKAATDAAGAIKDLKEVKLRSDEVGELRADPSAKKELAKLEAEVDALERERVKLQDEVEAAADAAKDPDLADLAAKDAEALHQKLAALKDKADQIKDTIDQKLKEHSEAKARQEAARLEAEQLAKEAGDTANSICDETDGTNRPDATVGDGTTEAILREEIETGTPIRSREGHWIKTQESIRGLEKAIADLNEARPRVQDPAKLKAIDDALARAIERKGRLEAALREWNNRAANHPDVFNSDGSSKKTPNWP